MSDFNVVVGKMIAEKEFREAMGRSPKKTLEEHGFDVNSSNLEKIKKLFSRGKKSEVENIEISCCPYAYSN